MVIQLIILFIFNFLFKAYISKLSNYDLMLINSIIVSYKLYYLRLVLICIVSFKSLIVFNK